MTLDRQYIIDEFARISRDLHDLADRVSRQAARAELTPSSGAWIPVDELAEEISHNVIWAIPNLHLERVVRRATQFQMEQEQKEQA